MAQIYKNNADAQDLSIQNGMEGNKRLKSVRLSLKSLTLW